MIHYELININEQDTENMLSPDDVSDAVEYVLASSPRCCPTEVVLRPQKAP